MAVSTIHPEYMRMRKEWLRNMRAAKGEREIKHHENEYLPIPDPTNETVMGERYQAYLMRAVFTNFTGRTVRALTGAVFRQSPKTALPTQLEYLKDDADSGGLTLETIAQRAVSETLTNGRFVVMADFPEAPLNATAEQTRDLRSYLACYPATALINWHVSGNDLDLAVLHERIEERSDDGFDFELIDYYRVLRLREEGVTLQLYRLDEAVSEEVTLVAGGEVLRKLPLVIIGSDDNNADPDTPPISDISSLNIAHYRNSADYEEGVFMHGQPMLHISTGDASPVTWAEANPSFQVGSRAAALTQNGSMELVQAQANSAAMEAMMHKEDQMIRLGAQIITASSGQETAEGARIRSSAEMSVLNTIVRNVSGAFEQMLKVCAAYEGANPEEVEFRLNDKFFAEDADPQVLAQLWLGVDRGAWGLEVPRDYGRRGGLIAPDKDDETLDEEASSMSPLAGASSFTRTV